jgi:hypothetical protein
VEGSDRSPIGDTNPYLSGGSEDDGKRESG